MFGKRSKAKAIPKTMVNGTDAGNLKGRGTVDKTAPFGKKTSLALPTYRNITESLGPSKGKAGPVKIT